MTAPRWEPSCYKLAPRQSLILEVATGELEVETMRPWFTGVYLHVGHPALGPTCTCRAHMGREHGALDCECKPLPGWSAHVSQFKPLLLVREPHLNAASDLALALFTEGADECVDLTCRHSRDEHKPRCRGEYETHDGAVFPCDCFGFREA